ncbi:MAG: heme ABC exporter ATP-binding protein CcmA [Pseudomonadota bacterium]
MRLSAIGMVVERGGRLVLSAPDFTVEAGQTAVLRGPNGAGKSTLLRALAALVPLASGDARLNDVSLASDGEDFAAHVAYAGHLDAVKPALTVRENLESWAAIYGASVGDGLARFALDHIADLPAGFCSAGQKRRLGLSRLTVMGRPLWLLDEPTVSLDAASVALFSDLVRDHCAGGGVAIAATHVDIGLPPGPVVEIAAPEAVVADQADPFLEDWG